MTEIYNHSHVNSPSFARDLAYVRFRTAKTRGARIGGISLPLRANLPFYSLLTRKFSRRLNLWKRQAGQPEYRQEGFPPGVYWGRPCAHHRPSSPSRRASPLSRLSVFSSFPGSRFWSKSASPGRRKPPNGWRRSRGPVSALATDGSVRAARHSPTPSKPSRSYRRCATNTRGVVASLNNSSCLPPPNRSAA